MAVLRTESLVLRGVNVAGDVTDVMAIEGAGAANGKNPVLLSLRHPGRTAVPVGNFTGVPRDSADANQRRDAGGAGRSEGFAGGRYADWRSPIVGRLAKARFDLAS